MKRQVFRQIKRLAVIVAGGLVVIVGLIMVPYPGPGWLTVFAGLAILSTELVWAQKLLRKSRSLYGKWHVWLQRQPLVTRLAIMTLTGMVVLATMWVIDAFNLINIVTHQ